MAHKKLWHAMTNIGAINLKYTKTYDVTKSHGLPQKFVTPYCQMACHDIITYFLIKLMTIFCDLDD
jgi:hypothetical protein